MIVEIISSCSPTQRWLYQSRVFCHCEEAITASFAVTATKLSDVQPQPPIPLEIASGWEDHPALLMTPVSMSLRAFFAKQSHYRLGLLRRYAPRNDMG
jgi:hypothetical protein